MTPSIAFSSDDAVSLAKWLLDEISRGMSPVWPTTSHYADKVVEGFNRLYPYRPLDVIRAIDLAPQSGYLDWHNLFESLVEQIESRVESPSLEAQLIAV